jgi:hypothetical protein
MMAVTTAGLLAMVTVSSYAHSGGNGGGAGSAGGAGGNAGGVSAGHMSGTGLSSTNSTICGDRDKGLTRAADRANTHADSHVGVNSNKGKHAAVGRAI